MAITLLPTPPSRQDPANFNVRADEFLGALPTFGTEANSLATDVNNKQVTASNAATTATNAASAATAKAGEAEASADAADLSAQAANTAKLAAEAAFDSFDDRYLGAKATDPATDNDGNPLIVGALYFRTTAPVGMKVWTGTAWDDAYANLASKFDKTGGDINGNINFTGTARRITGDFSNATVSNRVLFQTKTLDAGTALSAIPNGTGLFSQFSAYSKSDPDNSSVGNFSATATDIRLVSTLTGTGAYLPLTFHAGDAERLRIDPATGNVLATSGALGYGVGAVGTVAQATSKGTDVTLNKPSGLIVMNNAALAAGSVVSFQLYNSFIGAGDLVVVQPSGGGTGNEYQAWVSYRTTGLCLILVRNNSAGSRSDPIGITFAIYSVATS